jgi:hypothetical protein
VLLLPLVWLAGPLTIRRTAALIVPAALLLMPWAAFNAWTTGSLLPATATAKVEGGLVALMAGTREPLRRALVTRPLAFAWEWVTWLWQVNVLLPLLIVPGLAVAGMRGGRRLLLPASVLLLHPLAMALLAAYRGPSFQEGRYSIHLLPLAFTVAVTALARAGPARPRSSREAAGRGSVDAGRMRRLARGSVALGLLVAAGLALPPAASRYGWAVQNIEVMQVHLGRWVRENTPREARLALNDVGAIAYVSRREVVDMMGLVTPGIVPYRRQGEAAVLRYLEGRCPDYLIVFPEWFPELVAREDHFAPVHRVRLPRNTVAGADEMVVYETVWNRWRPSPRPCDDSPSRGTAAAAGPESSVAPRS